MDSQPLGIVLVGGVEDHTEIREIVPGSPASLQGMTSKVVGNSSSGGQTSEPAIADTLAITEVNGRPLNLVPKEFGEACDRLGAVGLNVTVVVQPTDFVTKLRKQLKTIKNYREFTIS